MLDLAAYFLAILPTPPTNPLPDLAADGVGFFTLWISRVGGVIAFIGAIKFALSIKSDDAREQIQSVLTMVSGFMIVSAVNNLDIFAFGALGADAEFDAIMEFITKWVGSVGGLTLFIGAILFGFAIKDQNPSAKVNGLKTMAAGGITTSVSLLLPMFV